MNNKKNKDLKDELIKKLEEYHTKAAIKRAQKMAESEAVAKESSRLLEDDDFSGI